MLGVLETHYLPSAKNLSLPWPDVYHTPEYAEADLKTQQHGTIWELVIWRPVSGSGAVVYGFYKRPILYRGTVVGYDICSPYGYAAPFAINESSVELWAAFRSDFESMCYEQSYVSEFVRFNPLATDDTYGFTMGCQKVNSNFNCRLHQTTVGVDLKQYWTKATTRHRTATRKAQKLGYVTEIRLALLEDFHGESPFCCLYRDTMKRLEAKPFYWFSNDYFQTLCKVLTGKVYIAFVKSPDDLLVSKGRDNVVAGALFLHHGARFHYHLAGSDRSHTSNGVNNYLQDAAARYAADVLNCDVLHLGGGQTNKDRLFSYKRSIGHMELECHVGTSILHKELYDRFVALRAARLGCSPEDLVRTSNFHPAYRSGIENNDLAF